MLAAFDAAADKAGVLHETYLEKCPTFAVPDLLVDYARLRDLTIVPVPESYDQWYAEAVIFGSGRPTLVLPESPRPRPFELGTVAIAWDFSRAAARAVSDAMPLLEKAKKVRIVTVTNEKKLDTKHFAEELAKNLARHGIDVVLDKVDASGRRIGEVLEVVCSFASGRRSRDGRLRDRAMARVHPRRRHQEPAVKAAASDHVLALTTAFLFRRATEVADDRAGAMGRLRRALEDHQSASLTLQISCSTGSDFTSKPRLRHIASMTVFSDKTSPEIAFSPSDLAYSMIICISVQPSPLPLRSDRRRMAYSPLS